MSAALPLADPPNSEGICSYLWIAHRGDADNGGGERAQGDGEFENAADGADARNSTSTSTASSSCSALACLRHPFVRALADGSLPTDSFRFYVAQGEEFRFFFLGGGLCSPVSLSLRSTPFLWFRSLTLFFPSSLCLSLSVCLSLSLSLSLSVS